MNKTKVTKRKGSKIKKDNRSAEVFVLPPNLLEQLGIDLENIGSEPESTSESHVTDTNVISKEDSASENRLTPQKHSNAHVTPSSEIESSITETAALMKKSVFLSPTFISHNTSVIHGEIEIVGNSEPESIEQKVTVSLMNNEYADKTVDEVCLDLEKEHEDVSNVNKSYTTPISFSNQETKQCTAVENVTIEMHDVEMQTLFDDHADEAYSSDCSNSNTGCTIKSDLNKSNKNKINIISEQIIHPSQFYKLKSGYTSQDNTLFHVPINTMIKNHKNNIYEQNATQSTEITVVNECHMHDPNCVKEAPYTSTVLENGIQLQNINNSDTSVTFNESESEFIIISQSQENPQQDTEILQVCHERDAYVQDTAFTSVVIPCHVDTGDGRITNKGSVDLSTNTEGCTERHENKLREVFKEIHTDSCLDRDKGDSSHFISHEGKSAIGINYNTSTACVIETENNIKNTLNPRGNQNCFMEIDVCVEPFSPDKHAYQEVSSNFKELKTAEQKNIKRLSEIQNEIPDLINHEKKISFTGKQQSNQFETESVSISHSVDNNQNSSRSTSNIKQNKQDINKHAIHSVIKASTQSTNLNVKHNKAHERGMKEPDNEQVKQKDIWQCHKPHEEKIISNEMSLENINEGRIHKDSIPQEDNIEEIAKCHEKKISFTGKQQSNQFKTESLSISHSVDNNQNSSRGASNIKQNKQDINKQASHSVIKASTQSTNLNVKDNKAHERGKKEPDDEQVKQKAIWQCHKPHEVKIISNEMSLENINEGRIHKDSIPQEDKIEEIAKCDEKKISFTGKQQSNQFKTESLSISHSVDNNQNCSRGASNIKQNKQDINKQASHSVIKASTQSTNLNVKDNKAHERGMKEPDDEQVKQKAIWQCHKPHEIKIISNEMSLENINEGRIHKDSIPQEDKIKEIAKYLSKFADMQRRKKNNETNKIASRKILSDKKHTTYSKSSIQGVEKPGGSEINLRVNNDPPFITYGRSRQQRCKTVRVYVSKDTEKCTQSINLTENNSLNNTSKEMELCLCDDFGRLTYYDSENSYEHLHFWDNTKSNCTPDLIFSIYNDEAPAVTTDDYDDKEECLGENSYMDDRKLCWNEIKFINDKFDDRCNLDFNNKRNESIEKYIHKRDKHIEPKVDPENEGNNKCKETQKIEIPNGQDNMIPGDVLQNCEGPSQDLIDTDEQSAKTGKKRKSSIRLNDYSEPLPKKYGNTSKQLPRAKRGRDYIDKNAANTNNAKESSPAVISETESIGRSIKEERTPVDVELVTCGVCEESMQNTHWTDHIASRHDYLAWKLGEPSLDINDDVAVREHLYEITKACGGLTCAKCGLTRKYVKAYLNHIRSCNGLNESQNDSTYNVSWGVIPKVELASLISNTLGENDATLANADLINCGVCGEAVEAKIWSQHIGSRHDYLAWKVGDSPLDVNDQAAVRNHLNEITKTCGGLTCAKCGLIRKYVKAYLSHIQSCNGLNESQNDGPYKDPLDITPGEELAGLVNGPFSNTGESNEEVIVSDGLAKCGVCGESVQEKDWNSHIATRHDYLAWKHGDPSLDVHDKDAVREHLNEITKAYGRLRCAKCGLTRKYAKAYLSHIKNCNGLNESQNDSTCNISTDATPGLESVELAKQPINNASGEQKHRLLRTAIVKCDVCKEKVQEPDWFSHAASRHGYLAWKFGEPPLDMNNETAVRDHLIEIANACGGLKCTKCELTIEYVDTYLSHIKNCIGNESQDGSACNILADSGRDLVAAANSPTSNISREHDALVKCALCAEYVLQKDWNDHRASRHNYLAWKCGDQCLEVDGDVNDDDAIRQYLYRITKSGGLRCAKSDITKEYIKSYVDHVKFSHAPSVPFEKANPKAVAVLVKCGVCGQYMVENDWIPHIATKHGYVAWRDGQSPLDVNDEDATLAHLKIISKEIGGLSCPKCGLQRKYPKAYLDHVRYCDDVQENTTTDDDDHHEELNHSENEEVSNFFKCGACSQIISESSLWVEHLSKEHNYLAWKDGETPLDINDEEKVYQHLYNLSKTFGGLICKNCGKNRRHQSYLEHVKNCNQPGDEDVICAFNCGECNEVVTTLLWENHISEKHDYLAWKDGDTPLDVNDEEQVYQHLCNLSKEFGGLICKHCGKNWKYAKSYLEHVKNCKQSEVESAFKCGVCNEVVTTSLWENHLSKKHDYLAWKDGDAPLDLDDEDNVHQHLYDFRKQFGVLICKNCGVQRKYVKSYLEHLKTCNPDASMTEASMSEEVHGNNSTLDFEDSDVDFSSGGTCAICQKEVEPGKWIQHTQKEHNYLAWREGEKPWDIEDFADVNQYLYPICKRMNGLTCNKCGLVRKYVKTYLSHIKSCNVTDFNFDSSVSEGIGPVNKDTYQCAMCKKDIKPADWNNHAMKKHYNVTWIIGQTPIDIKNPYAVEKYLKKYKEVNGSLKCNTCGATRASFAGFYAHIITCGKTEQEIDMFRSVCDVCSNKYLCIYKNQHAMIHKVQMYTAELKAQKKKVEKKENLEVPGKRRAAVKARSVIEKYSDNMIKHLHNCQSCGYGTDFEDELKTHKCELSNGKDFSGDESSATELGSSDEESPDTDVDSNISNEANQSNEGEDEGDDDEALPQKKRIREVAPLVSKIVRIPFKVEVPNSYIRQGDDDFLLTHFTDEVLFPHWRCEYEAVLESELTRYLPPLEKSCKVKIGSDSDWTTLKRFEAKKNGVATTTFVGASIVCIAWAPVRVEEMESSSHFLAVACHNGSDCPRYQGDEMPIHENLIQIWDYGTMKELPQISFGIAHDFGTVWSMDWCPSGARDALPQDADAICRLGFLAVACSSGSAYIFSVPHPSTVVKNNKFIHKLKPVAELRMTMCSERKRYQATSLSWSKQKGHTIVLVGYADGSTAYYDLLTASPLLRTTVNDIEVIYPYHDERPHNTCITGTDLYPVWRDDASGCGAGAWSAPTGAQLGARAGAGAAGPAGRARLHVSSHDVAFAPHAAAAMLAGDDALMQTAISELVWVPPGRRVGPVHTVAGCARCGRVVASMPPTLRVMRPHPAYWDLRKQIVGMLEMAHLAKKRKKQVNDELAMKIEPLTYNDAVHKYGIEFKKISKNDKVLQQQCAAKPKAHCPERFPLADVKSMAFCPSRNYHDKLAVATHAGIVILMTLN